MRVLIVDDEPPARDWLRELLSGQPDVEVLGECESGREAIEAIERTRPELVFLDVQMPGLDGFEVLREIRPECMPAVVFVTAHDRHALRAFDSQALDYLLKPFDAERLERALARARTRLSAPDPLAWTRRLLDLIESRMPASSLDRLVIRSGRGILFLKPQDVDWVHAEGNYVRIHKSILVNTERIREIQPLLNGGHVVLLTDGTKLTWSRGYRSRLRELTGSEG